MTGHQFCTSICQVLSKGVVLFRQVPLMLGKLVLSYIHLTSVINYQVHSFMMSYSSCMALSGFSGCFDLFGFSSHQITCGQGFPMIFSSENKLVLPPAHHLPRLSFFWARMNHNFSDTFSFFCSCFVPILAGQKVKSPFKQIRNIAATPQETATNHHRCQHCATYCHQQPSSTNIRYFIYSVVLVHFNSR